MISVLSRFHTQGISLLYVTEAIEILLCSTDNTILSILLADRFFSEMTQFIKQNESSILKYEQEMLKIKKFFTKCLNSISCIQIHSSNHSLLGIYYRTHLVRKS